MVDKNSLRLGNLVGLAHESNAPIATIREIKEEYVTARYKDAYGSICFSSVSYDLLIPIDLSWYWLDRLGFTKKPVSAFENIKMPYWVHEGVCLFYNDNPHEKSYLAGYGFNTFEGKYYGATMRWINHVHTIQNIFSSITGKELTIKEPIK